MNTARTLRTLAAAVLCAASLAAQAAPQNRVVFHVTEHNETTWNQALNNAANIKKTLGPDNVALEIVLNGAGIDMAKFDATVADRVSKAVESGIDIVVCEATMKGQKLTKQDMNAKVGYVPGGMVEIIRKQQEGWTYIKP